MRKLIIIHVYVISNDKIYKCMLMPWFLLSATSSKDWSKQNGGCLAKKAFIVITLNSLEN